LQTIFTLTNII